MLEMYGTARCPHTQEMRDWLEFRRRDFIEYDVEVDAQARHRIRTLIGSKCNVPVLVEDGKVLQVGWQGRSCMVELE
jgi:glutaredoxin 3